MKETKGERNQSRYRCFLKYIEAEEYLAKIQRFGDVDETIGVKIPRGRSRIDEENRRDYDYRR